MSHPDSTAPMSGEPPQYGSPTFSPWSMASGPGLQFEPISSEEAPSAELASRPSPRQPERSSLPEGLWNTDPSRYRLWAITRPGAWGPSETEGEVEMRLFFTVSPVVAPPVPPPTIKAAVAMRAKVLFRIAAPVE